MDLSEASSWSVARIIITRSQVAGGRRLKGGCSDPVRFLASLLFWGGVSLYSLGMSRWVLCYLGKQLREEERSYFLGWQR